MSRVCVRALYACVLVAAFAAVPRAQPGAQRLLSGEPVTGELPQGGTHVFHAQGRGGLGHVRLDAHGGQVRLRVLDGRGAPIAERSRVGGRADPLSWRGVVTSDQVVAIEVTSLETTTWTFPYRLAWTEGPSTGADADLVAADEALARADEAERHGAAGLADALAAFELARARAVAAGDTDAAVAATLGQARVLAAAGRSVEAETALDAALALARQAGAQGLLVRALCRRGELLSATGRPADAVAPLEEALDLARAVLDRRGEADALLLLAGIAGQRSDLPKTRDLLAQALRAAEDAADRRLQADCHNYAGVANTLAGDPAAVMRGYDRALALRVAIGDEAGQAQTMSNIGALRSQMGEDRDALEFLTKALELRRRFGNVQAIANTLHNLSVSYGRLGEYELAISLASEAVDDWRRTGGQRGEAFGLVQLGDTYARLGDTERARASYEASLPLWRALGDRRGEALAHTSLGSLRFGAGDAAAADREHDEALRLARAADLKKELGAALVAKAATRLAAGRVDEALALANEALEVTRAAADRREQARALTVVARAHLRSGRAAEALAPIDDAVALQTGAGLIADEAFSRAVLAEAQAATGDLAAARTNVLAAIARVETLRASLVDDTFRIGYFSTQKGIYERAIQILQQLSEAGDATAAEDAWQVAERARARVLLDGVERARVASGRSPLPATQLALERSEDLVVTKADRLRRLAGGRVADGVVAAARADLERVIAERDQLRERLRQEGSARAALNQPTVARLDDIRSSLLREDTALLEYFVGTGSGAAWVVDGTTITMRRLPGRAALQAMVSRLRAALIEPARVRPSESLDARAARVAAARRAMSQAAAEVASVLVGPAPLPAARRLLVVADESLQDVPFGLLPVTAAATGRPAALAARHTLVLAPSASVAAALSRLPRPGATAPRVVVFADPVYSPADERVASSDRRDRVTGAGTESPSASASLTRLWFSREEALQVAAAAPRATTLALGLAATREAALGPATREANILHFATHAIVDQRRPDRSGIVLSQLDTRGRATNGLVSVPDVEGISLAADLVALSGCQTALGTPVPGEGVVGLARAFLAAGARAVLATLWPVDDRSTAAFMGRFYRELLVNGLSPDEALRAAQAWLRAQPQWTAPFHWAPFVLVGSAREGPRTSAR